MAKGITPVIFRVFKSGGDVIALFPTIPAGIYSIQFYQHGINIVGFLKSFL